MQIQCNTGTYIQSNLLSKCSPAVEHSAIDICQLPPVSFKTHFNSSCIIWAPDYVLFLSSALHCFYLKLLFIVCCMASWYTSAYLLMVRYSSNLSRHRYQLAHLRPHDSVWQKSFKNKYQMKAEHKPTQPRRDNDIIGCSTDVYIKLTQFPGTGIVQDTSNLVQ